MSNLTVSDEIDQRTANLWSTPLTVHWAQEFRRELDALKLHDPVGAQELEKEFLECVTKAVEDGAVSDPEGVVAACLSVLDG